MTVGYLDTNILIAFFGGEIAVKNALERFAGLKLPAAAYVEFMTGLKTAQEEAVFDEVIHSLFDIVQTDMKICREATALRRKMRLKLPDALIYATARAGGGVLITRNTKDFDPQAKDIEIPR